MANYGKLRRNVKYTRIRAIIFVSDNDSGIYWICWLQFTMLDMTPWSYVHF
jgi:hypothetical protein